MGLLKVTGGAIKSIFDVKSWLGYDQLKETSKSLINAIKPGFASKKATYKETFEEAIARHDLTEDDLVHAIHRYQKQILIFSFFSVGGAIYTLYLFWNAHFFAGLISLALTLLLVVRAFAAHFYIFQIKNKKLGCSLKEYFDGQIKQEN